MTARAARRTKLRSRKTTTPARPASQKAAAEITSTMRGAIYRLLNIIWSSPGTPRIPEATSSQNRWGETHFSCCPSLTGLPPIGLVRWRTPRVTVIKYPGKSSKSIVKIGPYPKSVIAVEGSAFAEENNLAVIVGTRALGRLRCCRANPRSGAGIR